jgi:hypothetical protein
MDVTQFYEFLIAGLAGAAFAYADAAYALHRKLKRPAPKAKAQNRTTPIAA